MGPIVNHRGYTVKTPRTPAIATRRPTIPSRPRYLSGSHWYRKAEKKLAKVNQNNQTGSPMWNAKNPIDDNRPRKPSIQCRSPESFIPIWDCEMVPI